MNNQKLMWGWCIAILAVLFTLFSISSCVKGKEENEFELELAFSEVSDKLMEEVYEPVFQQYEYQQFGYSSMVEWFNDMKDKNAEAEGMADKAIEKYSRVISDEQEEQLRKYEDIMTSTLSVVDYEKASDEFEEITDDLAAASRPVYSGGGSGGTGSYTGGSTPYNFKVMGVLYDSQWRYTYYSSRVLYHYMTPQWYLGSDGIYRDSAGRVVVACDSYPHGTVLQTELFGTCIVLDCGVGRGDTLDVYVGW